jgi:hypothetical protein
MSMTNDSSVRRSGRRGFASAVAVSCVLLVAAIFIAKLAMGRKEVARNQAYGRNPPAQVPRGRLDSQANSGRQPPPRFSRLPLVENRRTRAVDLVMKSRLEGTKLPSWPSMFEQESRDRVWAPAMEEQLAVRIQDANKLFSDNGFSEFQVSEADCRESMCALSVSYPESALARARELNFLKPKETPWGHVLSQLGSLAEIIHETADESVWNSDGSRSIKRRIHLAFGEASSDPAKYLAWQNQMLRAKLDREQKARAHVP